MNPLKTAVITGAGSGVGRATAIQMVADGWRVALFGRRQEAIEETARLTGNPDACLPIACDVGETLPAVLNASNEIAVQAFLDGKIGFSDIPKIIRDTMDHHTVFTSPGLDEILWADSWARAAATTAIEHI